MFIVGWLVSGGTAYRERIRRAWDHSAEQQLQHRPHRASLWRPQNSSGRMCVSNFFAAHCLLVLLSAKKIKGCVACVYFDSHASALWRSDGQHLSGEDYQRSPAGRNLQPWRSKPRQSTFQTHSRIFSFNFFLQFFVFWNFFFSFLVGFLRFGRIHGQRGRRRHSPFARCDSHVRSGRHCPLLPGLHQRALRKSAGNSAEGDHAVLSPLAVWRGEIVRLLDRHQLPRGIQHVCLQWDSVQPRKSQTRQRTFTKDFFNKKYFKS